VRAAARVVTTETREGIFEPRRVKRVYHLL
jgi:hypothetical protein